MPDIIDIAGFTRISANGIRSVIELSGLPATGWVAAKEFTSENRPYFHLYVEIQREAFLKHAISTDVLRDLLTTYFKYTDQDYRDLKKLLGMDPLRVTVLRTGSFAAYEARHGRRPRQMNPDRYQLDELLACAGEGR